MDAYGITICNVLHGWSRGQKNEQQNNAPDPKGPVKIELLKGAGLLKNCLFSNTLSFRQNCIFGEYDFLQASRTGLFFILNSIAFFWRRLE